MATTQGVSYVELPAAADLSAKQYFFISANTSGQAAVAAAGDICIGTLDNKPSAAGTQARIMTGQFIKYIAGGAVTAGDLVTPDSAGEGVTAKPGDFVACIALETLADGEIGRGFWVGANVSDLRATPQTLTGAGAVNLTTRVTWIVTTGADALTLADGVEGQEKFIVMKTDGGDGTLTPTSFANGSTITFNDVGDSVHLLFTNASWHLMGSQGVAIA